MISFLEKLNTITFLWIFWKFPWKWKLVYILLLKQYSLTTYPILLSYTSNRYILQVFREIVIIVYSIIYFSPISSFYQKLETQIIIFEQYVNFRFPILAQPWPSKRETGNSKSVNRKGTYRRRLSLESNPWNVTG